MIYEWICENDIILPNINMLTSFLACLRHIIVETKLKSTCEKGLGVASKWFPNEELGFFNNQTG